MQDMEVHFRPATPDDAPSLAELINFAGEGLPLYLWERLAEPGESAWDVGRRRARREEGSFSYRNTTLAQRGGLAIGCLVDYKISEQPETIDDETPGIFVPLLELENLALGTWYVNVLAVYPEFRGQGIGADLLQLATRRAEQNKSRGESIIVADTNTGARRLYERMGYRFVAERPMVKDDWENPGRNWVLLVK